MSVFNGFEELAKKLYGTFDPDLKITASVGKSFFPDEEKLQRLKADPDVFAFSQTIEENVLVRYGDQQEIAVMKGVDEHYTNVTGIDTMMLDGKFLLRVNDAPQAVVGAGLAGKLHIGLHFITPMHLYVVRSISSVSLNPETALSHLYIFPSGVFAVDEEIDSQYLLVPLEFARDLLENDSITGAIEVKLKPGVNGDEVQKRVAAIFGSDFDVKTTYQQKEFYYRILKYEKWVAFMILAFVLLIASFNVVGSISMLMIEKKSDMFILQSLGSDKQLIGRIFITQGWMIVLSGALAGMLIGALICWLQIKVGIVSLPGGGTYVIDSYPVALHAGDFVMILAAVVCISIVTIYFPVKYFVGKYVN